MNGNESEQDWAGVLLVWRAHLAKTLPAQRELRSTACPLEGCRFGWPGPCIYAFVQPLTGGCCDRNMFLATTVWLTHWPGATPQMV